MRNLLVSAVLALFSLSVSAADVPPSESKQTEAGLYVTAFEAYQMLTTAKEHKVVLVDVRDPVEIMFTGSTKMTDIYVPYKIIDTSSFNPKKDVYNGVINFGFTKEVIARLDEIGADKNAHIIFMCRSGSTRSAPAADALYRQGYKNVYSMVDGFQGEKIAKGVQKGMRAQNGWVNSGLPWSWRMESDKAYIVAK